MSCHAGNRKTGSGIAFDRSVSPACSDDATSSTMDIVSTTNAITGGIAAGMGKSSSSSVQTVKPKAVRQASTNAQATTSNSSASSTSHKKGNNKDNNQDATMETTNKSRGKGDNDVKPVVATDHDDASSSSSHAVSKSGGQASHKAGASNRDRQRAHRDSNSDVPDKNESVAAGRLTTRCTSYHCCPRFTVVHHITAALALLLLSHPIYTLFQPTLLLHSYQPTFIAFYPPILLSHSIHPITLYQPILLTADDVEEVAAEKAPGHGRDKKGQGRNTSKGQSAATGDNDKEKGNDKEKEKDHKGGKDKVEEGTGVEAGSEGPQKTSSNQQQHKHKIQSHNHHQEEEEEDQEEDQEEGQEHAVEKSGPTTKAKKPRRGQVEVLMEGVNVNQVRVSLRLR